MTSSHLVARLNPAFNGQVNLDHFQYARRQVITRGDFIFLDFVTMIELGSLRFKTFRCGFKLLIRLVVLESNFEPLLT